MFCRNVYIFNFLDFEYIWEFHYNVLRYMWKIFYCIHIFLSIFPDGPTKEFTLAASTTETLLSDLIPEIEYVVTITSYDEVEESVPVIGQLTSKHTYKVLFCLLFRRRFLQLSDLICYAELLCISINYSFLWS